MRLLADGRVWRVLWRAAVVAVSLAALVGPASAQRGGSSAAGQVLFASERAEGVRQDDVYAVDMRSGSVLNLTRTEQNDEGPLALSPDGSRLAVVRTVDLYALREGRSWLTVSAADGTGRRDLIPIPSLDSTGRPLPSWSPDGRFLAVARAWNCTEILCARREVWTVDSSTGEARRIARRARHPSWSANGTKIAYSGDVTANGSERTVVVAGPDGTGHRTLSPGRKPVFAPRGNLIAFFRAGPDRESGLWLVEADGSNRRRLLTAVRAFAWSPDGTRLLVERVEPAGLWLVDVSGDARRLTREYFDHDPTWSSDGTRIAWARLNRAFGDELHVMNVDGSGSRQIPLERVWRVEWPSWSRDGSRLYAVLHRNLTDLELFVMNPDGSSQRPLTENHFDDRAPSFSPDGSRVAFVRQIGIRGNRSAIFTMNPDGSAVRRVTPGRGVSDHNPAWSPDGKRIAFARTRRYIEGDKPDPPRLCIVAVGGGRVRCIVRYGDDPSWSPDGRMIVYSGFDKRTFAELRVVRPNGTRRRTLVKRMSSGSPAWSPDGRFIAFIGARRRDLKDLSLWVVRRDGTGLRRLVRRATWNRPGWSADGRTLFFARWVGRDIHADLELFRVNRDGTGLTRLTTARGDDVDPAVAAR